MVKMVINQKQSRESKFQHNSLQILKQHSFLSFLWMMQGKEFGWNTVELSLSWDFNVVFLLYFCMLYFLLYFVIFVISPIVLKISLQITIPTPLKT